MLRMAGRKRPIRDGDLYLEVEPDGADYSARDMDRKNGDSMKGKTPTIPANMRIAERRVLGQAQRGGCPVAHCADEIPAPKSESALSPSPTT